jgi:hypothetical protein
MGACMGGEERVYIDITRNTNAKPHPLGRKVFIGSNEA